MPINRLHDTFKPILFILSISAPMVRLTLEQMLNPLPESPFCQSESSLAATHVEYNIQLNTHSKLKKLYHYPIDKIIQYPETSETSNATIGHLFTMSSADAVYNPLKDFAYSLGEPGSAGRKNVFVNPLKDSKGVKVPCQRIYRTCTYSSSPALPPTNHRASGQGVKVCPYVPTHRFKQFHTSASRESLELQLQAERDLAAERTPEQISFSKDISFLGRY